jgi:hypothetical protein
MDEKLQIAARLRVVCGREEECRAHCERQAQGEHA